MVSRLGEQLGDSRVHATVGGIMFGEHAVVGLPHGASLQISGTNRGQWTPYSVNRAVAGAAVQHEGVTKSRNGRLYLA